MATEIGFIMIVLLLVIFVVFLLASHGTYRWNRDEMGTKIIDRCFESWKTDNKLDMETWRAGRIQATNLTEAYLDVSFLRMTSIYFLWGLGLKKQAISLLPNAELFMDLA